ncbi:protocatechuate 3,4-dioxygenase subunit alpha [Paracoccus sp. SM22M-07]|uniref:protocatechuate 3,4-dioxygenase subunit alpha n=1 Tax=Paracoccus sp. SM22M-07 TaxID=1520813 RepID=UPI0009173D58|nr:protocatechuate 3,4-dioxygenase subunit alpha [Paracoccus sp. SM22M-07]OJH44404.1 protocatechuate 3,4-dioxygenase [Paracoccus sp. SM22M-07]
MPQPLHYLKETPSQTAGPYVHIGLAPAAAGFDIYRRELGTQIAADDTPGPRVRITGRVIDGMGAPVKDALIEIWQADANGIYPHPGDPRHADAAPGFRGFARVIPDFDSGEFTIDTIKPGPVPMTGGAVAAPHLNLWLVARGINLGLSTRLYFGDENNAADPVLNLIEQADRRQTLIAERTADGLYRFDIRLQGDNETVFLDV